jgi:hypothetical protein
MIRLKIILIELCLLYGYACFSSCARPNTLHLQGVNVPDYDINADVRIAEADHLGNIFIVTDDNLLVKFDHTNQEKYRYANKRSGAITHLDVTNPLKILVFFDDFNYLLILDNTLTEITDLRLEDHGFMDISAAAIANDDNYWVYDPVQFNLVKVNNRGISLVRTSNTNDFGMAGCVVSSIREAGNFVVLMDKEKGFYIFDNLGQFVKYYGASGIRYFQFDGRTIFYSTSFGLFGINLRMAEEKMITALPTDYESYPKYLLETASDRIYVFSKGIDRYKK